VFSSLRVLEGMELMGKSISIKANPKVAGNLHEGWKKK